MCIPLFGAHYTRAWLEGIGFAKDWIYAPGMSPSVLTQQAISSAEFYRLARGGAFRRMLTELRRGRVVKLGPHYIEHGRVQAELRNALYLATAIEPTWHVLTAATISYGNGFEPLPDILVIDTSVRETPNDSVSPAAVKLVVEVDRRDPFRRHR